MSKALVVLSGGQDSTTCLFWAKQEFKEIHAITFEYGQRHAIEVESARMVAELAGVVSHETIWVPQCLVSISPLTSETPLEQYENFEQMDKVIGDRQELTFVPMRNPFFLVIAANRAEKLGIHNIVTGICEADNANYSDCRESFRKSFEQMVNQALGYEQRFKIIAPLMHSSKANTVRLAKTLPGCWEALAYTHTSYNGEYPPTDKNHANILRAHGFEQAGLPDPLVLRAWKQGLMDLPNTPNYQNIQQDLFNDYS